jgi:trk system potassium uptake protein
MHLSSVLRVLSLLLFIVSLFMLFPIFFGLYYREGGMIRFFLIPMGGTAVVSLLVLYLTRDAPKTLSIRDGFLLVTLSWVFSALIGSLPFFISGVIPRFADAYFETMSGFTTTGASILTDIEALPKCMLFWRSLTHWLGGMGIVVLAVAVLPFLGIGAYQMVKAEAPGPTLDKIAPKMTHTAKILWLTYIFLTVAQTVLLMFGGMNLFDALTHTFGTVATGGFSPKGLSVGHYDSAFIDIVITVFMILAGMNFILYYRLISGKVGTVLKNTEFKTYIGIFAAATIIMAIVLTRTTYPTFGKSLRYAGFQAASILTTTGYATADYELWPHFPQIILFTLMFIGGCSGSTGGGVKVIRILTLVKLAFSEMKYLAHPRGVFNIKIGEETLKKDTVYTIAAFFFIYVFMLLLTAAIVASAGNTILTSMSTALATLGNIGPGFGKIGPTGNYAFYPDYVKWFLSFAMMVGRLELYTVLIILTPGFWRR